MSTKCGCTSPGSYAACAGFRNQTTPDEVAAQYADRVGAPRGKDGPTTCSVWALCRDVVKARRLPYYADNPGDCGKNTKVSITGAGTAKGIGIGSSAAGAFSGSVGVATGLTGSAAIEAGGLAAAGAIASIAAFGAGLIALPFAFIAHHSAEVALEKKVLCSVASGYNDFADQMDGLLATGNISVAQASQLADQIQQQIVTALQSGYKNCNARCYYTYAIKALTLFNKEKGYQILAASFKPQQQSQPSQPSTTGKGTAIAIGAGALALIAKVAGFF